MYGRPVQFRVLGPLEVDAGEGPIPLGGPKQRAVLAHLLVRSNQLVPAETLIDELWGDEPPDTARNTLQTYMSHLRKALGAGRLVGRPPGYVLSVEPTELDSVRFDDLLRQAKKAQGVDPALAVTLLDDALALWRGPALADVSGEASLVAESARLEDLRIAAQEERIDGLLASGQATRVIGEAEALLALHPLRERLWSQLMMALYREGRQADALGVFQRAREILADELGIDPSPELIRLQERVLRQDPALDLRGEPLRGYRLMEKIGEGSTGVVFRGIQPRVGRDVAVKMIHERLAGEGSFVRRFEPEAQAVAALEHPHIAPLYDYWRDPAGAYVVSRYLRAGSLRAIDERGEELPADRRRRIIEQVAAALAFAHRQDVAHGGIQPANVVLDAEGNAYLCDFRIGTGPPPTIDEDLEQLRTLARRVLGDEASAIDVIERLGVGEGAPGARALAEALGSLPSSTSAPGATPTRNPYKGLRPFAESDQSDFFGRTPLVERIVGRLNQTGTGSRFLAIVGPSGSGKSSVVRAGVVPSIRRGALAAGDGLVVAEMFPGALPLEELEAALVRVASRSISRLRDRLESGSRGLLEAAEEALPADTEAVLLVDQFEELFTLTRDERERELFLESLRVAAVDPTSRLRVIVTLRADFFDRPLAYPRFGELLGLRTEAVPPLTPDELERAIRGPAERVGVHAEPGLIAEMIADVAHQPGGLPLLQYSLTELFERREGNRLTLEGYLSIGGATGALSARAERLYEGSDADGRRAIRQVLLRLVRLGEGREDTRRRVGRAELDALEVDPAAIDGVLDGFGRHRLLTFDREPTTREPTVEIAHEALLGSWGRLRGWIDEAREDLRVDRKVSQTEGEWRASGGDPSFLLRGARLEQAEAWIGSTDLAVGKPERAFVRASADQRERDRVAEDERRERESRVEQRSRSRLRTLVGVLTTAALVASTLTVIAVGQAARAQRAVRLATARELSAASLANLDVDPERSILLALQAVATTTEDRITLREAEEALHRAVQADRLLLTLRHPSTANVDWSPDGRLVLTGGSWAGVGQTDALLWDPSTGRLIRTLSGHTADIDSVAFNHDGSRAVTTSADPDDRTFVWDTKTGEALLRLPGLGGVMRGAYFSPDGDRLALVDDAGGGRLRIVDVASGDDIFLRGSRGHSWCWPMFSPDGTRIAVGGCGNDQGAILDATTGRPLFEIGAENEVVESLVFSPDGTTLTGRTGGQIQTVWDAMTGRKLFNLNRHGGGVTGYAFSPDGTMIATGGNDGTARVWDAATGQELLVLAGHSGLVGLVDFSPDGNRLMTGGGDGTARIWDITSTGGAEWWSVAEPYLNTVEFDQDGSRLLAGGAEGGWLMRAARGERLVPLPNLGSPWVDADVSPDGSSVVFSNDSGAYLVNASTGEVILPLREDGYIPSVEFSPDGSVIATGVAWQEPDRGKVVLWDSETGRRISAFGRPLGPDDLMEGVAFSPDGALVAGIGTSGRLGVWEVASGREVLDIQAHRALASDIDFSPGGRSIATAGGDGAAVWSLATGEPLAAMDAGNVRAVAYSPDGDRLATAGDDTTTRVWDVATGKETLTLFGHTDRVSDVMFSPDGGRLASTSVDGTVRMYALLLDDLVRLARGRLTRSFTDAECRQFLHSLDRCPDNIRGLAPGSSLPPDPSVVGGPAGAFRVTVSEEDLLSAGFPESSVGAFAGDYTWSLLDGAYRARWEPTPGDEWSADGTYEVSGDRIVFTDRTRPCFGTTSSIGWSLRGTTLAFSDPTRAVGPRCPGAYDAWVRAVFLAEPWVRVWQGGT